MTRYVVLGLVAAVATAGAAYAQSEAPPPAAPPAAIAPYLVTAIDKVCDPLIHGQKLKDVSQATGLRRFRDSYALQGPGVERVIINPPSVANPTVCQMTINYEVGQTPGVVAALSNWAASQNPPMQVLSAGYAAGAGVTGWTWEYDSGAVHQGLVFDYQSADGKPMGRTFEVGTLLYSHASGG